MADLLEEEAALVVVRDVPEVPETPAEKYARRSSSPPAVFPAAPVMSAKEKIAAMEEAAAKARRERKVYLCQIRGTWIVTAMLTSYPRSWIWKSRTHPCWQLIKRLNDN